MHNRNPQGERHMLDLFHDDLVRLRDEHDAVFAEFGFTDDRGLAQAFRLALSLLSVYTGGEFGQRLAEQPEPGRQAVTR